MTHHLRLIRARLEHLARMREYLVYSLGHSLKRLAGFFAQLAKETPLLFDCFSRLQKHCLSAYGI